jgi:hypothetical protein
MRRRQVEKSETLLRDLFMGLCCCCGGCDLCHHGRQLSLTLRENIGFLKHQTGSAFGRRRRNFSNKSLIVVPSHDI